MNSSQKIYFPYRFCNLYLEIDGTLHYPDMNITIDKIEATKGEEVILFPRVTSLLEQHHQAHLYNAWIDFETKRF